MEKIILKKYDETDKNKIKAITEHNYYAIFQSFTENTISLIFNNGILVGWIHLDLPENSLHSGFVFIYIAPEHRGNGIGTHAYKQAEPMTEEEQYIIKEMRRMRYELQDRQRELHQIQTDSPRLITSVDDCLDFLSYFELKPFNVVRAFPKVISSDSNPGQDLIMPIALRLYARNLEVPLTHNDFEKCILSANTYWVFLFFMIKEDNIKEMQKYEAKILSGDYDFGDVPFMCGCQPFYSYLPFIHDYRNIPAFFKYFTNPNCTKKDEEKALELYDHLLRLYFIS